MIRNFIIDLDGVIYIDSSPTPGALSFCDFLRRRGYGFLFLTNNSTKTRRQYAAKLRKMGMTVPEKSILTSSEATCLHLKKEYEGERVYAIGEYGLRHDLEEHGFILAEERARLVVAGMDRRFSYDKLSHACRLIRDGARFVATNPDLTFPSAHGIIPGAGAIVAAIRACTSVRPFIVGKPNPAIMRVALRMLCATRAETAVLGDRLDTDVLAARRTGMRSVLLLTGIETRASCTRSPIVPDFAFTTLAHLKREWPF